MADKKLVARCTCCTETIPPQALIPLDDMNLCGDCFQKFAPAFSLKIQNNQIEGALNIPQVSAWIRIDGDNYGR